MQTSSSIERTVTVRYAHRIYFTRAVFSAENRLLAQVLTPEAQGAKAKVLLIIEEAVARAFPELAAQAGAYFADESCPARLVCAPLEIPGGEAAKNSRTGVEEILREIEAHGLSRHSYVVAVGGGALLDVAGFAAATAHRGVRLVRLPTTTLSQADGGVGVKNGINAFGKKNFLGTFAPPFAVINDAEFWTSLPPEQKRAGLIEAIKVALIRDGAFFLEMERRVDALARCEPEAMAWAIRRCAELHVAQIAEGGDPFEFGSARPLDFGHWAAHKLEQLSGFALGHGAAVALGLGLDTLYSCRTGRLSGDEAGRILALVRKLGFARFDPLMEQTDERGLWLLLEGLREFREHLGGELTITLLEGIGRCVEVHEIYPERMLECVRDLKIRHPEPVEGSAPGDGRIHSTSSICENLL